MKETCWKISQVGKLSQDLSSLSFFPKLVLTTASPARALTASLVDYTIKEVSTASFRSRALRSTTPEVSLDRPADWTWSGWEMPALEVIRYELFLMATCFLLH
jgi:hypothetical protein